MKNEGMLITVIDVMRTGSRAERAKDSDGITRSIAWIEGFEYALKCCAYDDVAKAVLRGAKRIVETDNNNFCEVKNQG